MLDRPTTHKIGKIVAIWGIFASLCLFATPSAQSAPAGDVQFTAEVDRAQIGRDDTVSLKFNLQAEGGISASPPTYEAPGFEVINTYDSSYSESYYDTNTGRFGMKNTQQLTKVLRPTKTGDLRISKIRAAVNGKTYTAPDIVVVVGPSGAGTPAPHGYGGAGVGLRGAGKRNNMDNMFVRAEVDKDHLYKGEQVIVSYYMYRRVRVLNVQVDKFPVLTGFLREELEMPVMQTRMDTEQVVQDGVAYQRSLLARYAAYPLQEGKLEIDPMAIKYSYFPNPGITDDGEDQDPIFNFFRSMAPSESSTKSQPVKVDVLPLPADGRPASFSGGVGDFNVVSAVNKTDVRANEAVSLTVKVEGRGNVAAIGEPKMQLPPSVELYDSKGTAKTGKGGVGEKVFEILLIPRQPGPLQLPGMEFSFFDPSKKQYVTRKTDPIQLNIQEAAPGSSAPAPVTNGADGKTELNPQPTTTTGGGEVMRDLKSAPAPVQESFGGFPVWRVVYALASVLLIGFFGLVGVDLFKKVRARGQAAMEQRSKTRARGWGRLQEQAKSAASGSLGWADVSATYELLNSSVLDAIDETYRIGARSLPRSELRRILVEEKGFDESRWSPIEKLLEHTETVRFAGSQGGAFEDKARSDLPRWVNTGESIAKSLSNRV